MIAKIEREKPRIVEANRRRVKRDLPEYLTGGYSVLDLGCGNGALLEVLQDAGNVVMGTEIRFFDMLAHLPHVRHDCATLPYPFEDGSYDLVSCVGAITMFGAPWLSVLAEMFRIARRTVYLHPNRGKPRDRHHATLDAYCPPGWSRSQSVHGAWKWTCG